MIIIIIIIIIFINYYYYYYYCGSMTFSLQLIKGYLVHGTPGVCDSYWDRLQINRIAYLIQQGSIQVHITDVQFVPDEAFVQ